MLLLFIAVTATLGAITGSICIDLMRDDDLTVYGNELRARVSYWKRLILFLILGLPANLLAQALYATMSSFTVFLIGFAVGLVSAIAAYFIRRKILVGNK